MKNTWIRNKRGRLSFSFGALSAALAFMIFIGLGAVAFAAPGDTENKNVLPSEIIHIFDPFKLKSMPVKVSQSKDEDTDEVDPSLGIVLFNLRNEGSPIRIPYRPTIRSPYRPPLVPRK